MNWLKRLIKELWGAQSSTQAPVDGIQSIPKIVHFIWLGSRLPEKYKQNLSGWISCNPDYKFNLYIDSAAIPLETVKDDVLDIARFCKKKSIKLNDVAILPEFSELVCAPWYNDWVNGEDRVYAFAADYLRLAILTKGGIYSDVDTECKTALGTLRNNTGIFVWGDFDKNTQPMFYDNCWIAAVKNNDLIIKCMHEMEHTYKKIMVQGKLPERVKIRISYTPLESDPDLIYNTMRFRSCVNDSDISNEFGAGNTLRKLYSEVLSKYGLPGVGASIFKQNKTILHAAHRSWLAGKMPFMKQMGVNLVSDILAYEQQMKMNKLSVELCSLRG